MVVLNHRSEVTNSQSITEDKGQLRSTNAKQFTLLTENKRLKRTITHRLAQLLDERHRLPLQTPREPNKTQHKPSPDTGSDEPQTERYIDS